MTPSFTPGSVRIHFVMPGRLTRVLLHLWSSGRKRICLLHSELFNLLNLMQSTHRFFHTNMMKAKSFFQLHAKNTKQNSHVSLTSSILTTKMELPPEFSSNMMKPQSFPPMSRLSTVRFKKPNQRMKMM